MPNTRVLIVASPSLAQLLQHTVAAAENDRGIHPGVSYLPPPAARQFILSLQHVPHAKR